MLFGSPFKFLHKTIQGIQSFLCGCGCGNYQKLPKHSTLPPHESSHVFQGFVGNCVSGRATKLTDKMPVPSSGSEIQTSRGECKHRKTANGGGSGGSICNQPRSEGGGRSCLVARRLKELEAFDLGNIQHVLDIEEAIHYYNLLKCPVYRTIVDELFSGIYVELLGDSADNAAH